jgi:hypothetical protein
MPLHEKSSCELPETKPGLKWIGQRKSCNEVRISGLLMTIAGIVVVVVVVVASASTLDLGFCRTPRHWPCCCFRL